MNSSAEFMMQTSINLGKVQEVNLCVVHDAAEHQLQRRSINFSAEFLTQPSVNSNEVEKVGFVDFMMRPSINSSEVPDQLQCGTPDAADHRVNEVQGLNLREVHDVAEL